MKTVVFDLDDFVLSPILDDIKRIKEHFPDFKITLFTVPLPKTVQDGSTPLDKYKDWLKAVQEYDWIEIAPHGLTHDEEEMMLSRADAEIRIDAVEKTFEELGVKIAKIWKSPYWQTSDDAYEALRDRGYTVCLDPNQDDPRIEGMKTYRWNWSIDQVAPGGDEVKGHGHCYGTNNDLRECLPNVFDQMPTDAKFMTIGEYVGL